MLPRVGCIPFLNAAPFYLHCVPGTCELVRMPPRQLGEAAGRGEIEAGPLSLLDFVGLERDFEPVGEFIIGVRRAARSVLLFSRVPAEALGPEAVVALTSDSTTSAALTRVLLRERFRADPRFVRGDREDADARLFIGDPALVTREKGLPGFPHCTDLGQAWWDWHHLPFVFAVFAVRRDLDVGVAAALAERVASSVRRWSEEPGLATLLAPWSTRLGLPVPVLRDYLAGLVHRKGPDEAEAVEIFLELARRAGPIHART